MALPKHILVIRLSAPGDVAMTVPVLHSFNKKYPDVKLSILTNRRLEALFTGLDATLLYAETKTVHKGFAGLLKLFKQLRKQNQFDAVADLHNVMRSQVIRTLFRFSGVKVAFIDKGRAEKKALTRKKNKKLYQLATSFDRYKKVFQDLGFDFDLSFNSVFSELPALPAAVLTITGEKRSAWIGIAPFAAFHEKTYPLNKMEEVVKHFHQQGIKLIYFGGPSEAAQLEQWQQRYPGSVNVAGKLNLYDELILISHLTAMVSMDSANMHFASLVNVPVISVWGPTHPFAGFLGWGQQKDNIVQIDLYCRPCSVFGNKPCYRGDHACMQQLPPLKIIERLNFVLQIK